MHRTMQYQWPGWRNIIIDTNQKQSSVNLDVASQGCVSWRYLDDGAPPVPRKPGDGYIPQIDGNYTLPAGPSYKDYEYDSEEIDAPEVLSDNSHRAFNLVNGLDLVMPQDNQQDHYRFFFMPPSTQPSFQSLTRMQPMSVSEGRLSVDQFTPPNRPASPWSRRWRRLTAFLNRFRPHQ